VVNIAHNARNIVGALANGAIIFRETVGGDDWNDPIPRELLHEQIPQTLDSSATMER
jgi:hypothetical protein